MFVGATPFIYVIDSVNEALHPHISIIHEYDFFFFPFSFQFLFLNFVVFFKASKVQTVNNSKQVKIKNKYYKRFGIQTSPGKRKRVCLTCAC